MALQFFKKKENEQEYLLALDVGTENIKALIFKIDEEKAVVVGFGEKKQGTSQAHGGPLSDLGSVVDNCEDAITQAANQAGATPKKMILGIAGQTVKGLTTFFRFERTEKEQKISEYEMEEIVDRIQNSSLETIKSNILAETGEESGTLKLVNSSLISVKIDGYEVPGLQGFKGEKVEVGFFNAYALSVHLDLMEALADELGLEIYAITAEPFSLVSGILPADKNNLTGIILDIGGTITDIILVQQGKILGTRVLPLGGRMITEKIADVFKTTYEEAESKKIQYIENEIEPTLKRKIKDVIGLEIELWVSGVEQALRDLGESEALPPQFLLCGGGASLPEIKDGLMANQWTKKLPFSKFPKIDFIVPDNILTVFDQTKMFSDHKMVTSMSLCKVALDLEKEEDATAKIISKTAHKMGI